MAAKWLQLRPVAVYGPACDKRFRVIGVDGLLEALTLEGHENGLGNSWNIDRRVRRGYGEWERGAGRSHGRTKSERLRGPVVGTSVRRFIRRHWVSCNGWCPACSWFDRARGGHSGDRKLGFYHAHCAVSGRTTLFVEQSGRRGCFND